VCAYHCAQLSYATHHRTDNFPFYPQDSPHSSDDVYWRGEGNRKSIHSILENRWLGDSKGIWTVSACSGYLQKICFVEPDLVCREFSLKPVCIVVLASICLLHLFGYIAVCRTSFVVEFWHLAYSKHDFLSIKSTSSKCAIHVVLVVYLETVKNERLHIQTLKVP